MASTASDGPKVNLTDYLAAERTLLAWIRTGLALMGFGFVVARFGLFLHEIQAVRQNHSGTSFGFSLWFGTILIVVGVFVNAFSGWHYMRLMAELDRGVTPRSRHLNQAAVIAILLALVGLAMAIYLISIRNSTGNSKEISMTPNQGLGIIAKPSHHSVDETVHRLKNILEAKGVSLFALIDHSGEAEKVGMKMRPTKLLIFGNPKGGTPLMLAAPSSALDLPLKILIWEDAQKKVWITFNSPEYLRDRHGIPADLMENIGIVETLADQMGE
jgi:uncharacterized protein (DUF302 family)/uncharacterized membrane protein YidH (DUF202 family)